MIVRMPEALAPVGDGVFVEPPPPAHPASSAAARITDAFVRRFMCHPSGFGDDDVRRDAMVVSGDIASSITSKSRQEEPRSRRNDDRV